MYLNSAPFEAAFGYPMPKGMFASGISEEHRNICYGLNVVGYFPIVGLVVCAARLILTASIKDTSITSLKPFRVGLISRAIAEGLGAGPALLIIDAVVSIYRYSKHHKVQFNSNF